MIPGGGSGRLSRAERQVLQKEDAAWLVVPLHPTDPRSMAAHLRHLVRLLRDPRSVSPCSDAVKHLTALYDRTIPTAAAMGVVCSCGCAYCCVQPVSLTAAEAFCVAAALRNRPGTRAAVVEADRTIRGMPADLQAQARIVCPLLEDSACSIYPARPLACHAFVSVKLEACIAAFVNGEEPQIPMPGNYVSLLYTARMMLMAALRLAGLPSDSYEMKAAVAAALEAPDAERRWLRGEPVLAPAPAEGPPPPQYEASIGQMIAFVAPTL